MVSDGMPPRQRTEFTYTAKSTKYKEEGNATYKKWLAIQVKQAMDAAIH